MDWQLYTAISVLSLSVSVILQRILLHRFKIDPYGYVILFQAMVGIVLMPFAIIHGFTLHHIKTVALPAFLSIILFGIGHIMYAKTLQVVEASVFSILFATQAVWTMLLGIVLLHESIAAIQVIGTVLIFTGVFITTKNVATIMRSKGLWIGLLTGLLIGVAVYAWSYTGRYVDPLSWAAISFVGTSVVATVIRPSALTKVSKLLRPQVLSRLLTLALFYALGSATMLFAYQTGSFAIVSPLRQTSIIVTVILALLLLKKERNNITRKITAAIVCTIGVILIVTG